MAPAASRVPLQNIRETPGQGCGYGGIGGMPLLPPLRLLSCSCSVVAAAGSWCIAAPLGRVASRTADGVRLWRPARSAFKFSTPVDESAGTRVAVARRSLTCTSATPAHGCVPSARVAAGW